MTTIINATDPAEFLGLVPALAGFTPRQSLVMLPFHGTRTRGAMRIDLPGPDIDQHDYADLALRSLLQVRDVDAVAIVVYSDDDAQEVPDGLLLPHLATVEAVADVCADAGLRIVDTLCVTPSGWGDYVEDEPQIREVAETPQVPGLGDVTGDQLAGAELPGADLVERERVGRALRDLEHEIGRRMDGVVALGPDDNPLSMMGAEAVLDDLPSFAEDVLEPPTIASAHACAALLWCLSRPALRDAILVQWARDHEFGCQALSAQAAFSNDEATVPDVIGEVFLGRGERPDPDRLRCALQVVRTAASRAPRHAQAGALTAAAWLSWALGHSSHAGAYVDEALRADPQHSLAALMSTMLSAAMLPEWVLRAGAAT